MSAPQIPTNIVDALIFIANMGLLAVSVDEALERLATGISATAEAAGRDVTDEEMAIIKQARDESAKRRKGIA